jgi:hypothetical protein
MTAFVNTGSDLKSATYSAAMTELCVLLLNAETSFNAANPTRIRNNVQLAFDLDQKVFAGTVTVPVSVTVGTNGQPQVIATDYLGAPYSAFVPATSDLDSTNLPAAALELAHKVQALELTLSEAERPNGVSVVYDFETGIGSITLNIPLTVSVSSTGVVQINSVNYV